MSLTTIEKKKLGDVRKWIKKERRRYRLRAHPRFSIGVDSRTKKLIVRYSVPQATGFDIKKDEPIIHLKKKNIYTSLTLADYLDFNVKYFYDKINKEIDKSFKETETQTNFSEYAKEFYTTPIRFGKRLSPESLRSDKPTLLAYINWLEKKNRKYLDVWNHIEDGKRLLNEYLTEKSQTTNRFGRLTAKNTLHNNYVRIKTFFNWISEKEKDFPRDIVYMKGWTRETNKDKLPPAVSVDDMKVLIKWMDSKKGDKYERHFIPILRLLLITGCRIGEATTMRLRDIDTKKRTWNFTSKGRNRTIKLDSDTLWDDLGYWVFDKNGKKREDKEWVFHSEYWRFDKVNNTCGGVKMNLKKHITQSGVQHKFKNVIKELGLDERLTPHACRRGFITYMLEKTEGNVPLVAQIVGHNGFEMVNRYNRARIPKERTTIDLGDIINE